MSAAPKGDRAVRAQKKPGKLSSGEAWERLEFYPTPPWATRALFEYVLPHVGRNAPLAAWDPCAGMGHMADVLREYCVDVHASDVYRYPGAPEDIAQRDFLDSGTMWPADRPGWIITNPPFVPAADILEKAMRDRSVLGVALLLRLQWLTGADRYRRVFFQTAPALVAPFVERVPMCLGGYDLNGSTATDYAWFVWSRGKYGNWGGDGELLFPTYLIPPCKDRLFRETDRLLSARHVPGWVTPSRAKKVSPDQGTLAVP